MEIREPWMPVFQMSLRKCQSVGSGESSASHFGCIWVKEGGLSFIDEVVRFKPLLIKELWEFDVKMDLHCFDPVRVRATGKHKSHKTIK